MFCCCLRHSECTQQVFRAEDDDDYEDQKEIHELHRKKLTLTSHVQQRALRDSVIGEYFNRRMGLLDLST